MQAAKEDLPVGWEANFDAVRNSVFYFNRVTGKRTWQKPRASSPSGSGSRDVSRSRPRRSSPSQERTRRESPSASGALRKSATPPIEEGGSGMLSPAALPGPPTRIPQPPTHSPQARGGALLDHRRVCKYGRACYNKSARHLEAFAHPWLVDDLDQENPRRPQLGNQRPRSISPESLDSGRRRRSPPGSARVHTPPLGNSPSPVTRFRSSSPRASPSAWAGGLSDDPCFGTQDDFHPFGTASPSGPKGPGDAWPALKNIDPPKAAEVVLRVDAPLERMPDEPLPPMKLSSRMILQSRISSQASQWGLDLSRPELTEMEKIGGLLWTVNGLLLLILFMRLVGQM